ncbi:MAG: VWA domain-containing protein [Clostridiales bacterium]|nr:VWA domain-containing protein [Clostridiales bacterium]
MVRGEAELSFNNPWALLALLLIIPIILLYLLRKQHEDYTVSSTMLWQRVLQDLQAAKPWQRLRTRLLLILQVLAVIFFALSLARPVWSRGMGGSHFIAVIDTSARMQAVDVKPNRMEAARNALIKLIDSMNPGDIMSIVQAGRQPLVLAGSSNDKAALKQAAEEIEAGNGKTDLGAAVQLAQAILQERGENSGRIHVFSDFIPSGLDEENLVFHLVSGNGKNAAITHVGYERAGESISVISRVANFGPERNITLELKADDMLLNVKEANVPENEEVAVYWPDIPVSVQKMEVSISDEDDLMLDNSGLALVSDGYKAKVMLVTERNVFLERAVSLREDIELLKADTSEIPDNTDFHLYIYDGALPEELPDTGHIIAFAPSSHEHIGLVVEGEIRPSRAAANDLSVYSELLQYVEPEGYQIARAGRMNVPEGFTVLLYDEREDPLLIAGEQEGRKIVLFAFSLHESNLPLKADFPILMQNLLNWLLPQDIYFAGQIFSGESLQIESYPDASRITVISPSGREYEFDAYPPPVFYDTQEVGIYRITHQAEEQEYEGSFIVSVPTDDISDLRTAGEVPEGRGEAAEAKTSPFERNIWMAAGWILLLLLLTEWWVYHHGA